MHIGVSRQLDSSLPNGLRAEHGTIALGTRLVGARGEYQATALLGTGGVGEVYAAHDLRTRQDVAIKVLTKVSWEERFKQEAIIGYCLSHPNLVKVFDAGVHRIDSNAPKRPFFVMERLCGATLDTLIPRAATTQHQGSKTPNDGIAGLTSVLSCRWKIDVAIYIARGVALLHAHNIIHRDVKPSNIFLVEDSSLRIEPKLLDFGIAKRELTEELTQTREVFGTTGYMAPEQLRNTGSADERSDIWSLAAVLFDAIEGIPRLWNLEVLDPKYPPDNWDPGLWSVLAKALHHDPARRPATIREFAAALEPFGSGTRFGIWYPFSRAKNLRIPDRRWPTFEQIAAAQRIVLRTPLQPRRLAAWLLLAAVAAVGIESVRWSRDRNPPNSRAPQTEPSQTELSHVASRAGESDVPLAPAVPSAPSATSAPAVHARAGPPSASASGAPRPSKPRPTATSTSQASSTALAPSVGGTSLSKVMSDL